MHTLEEAINFAKYPIKSFDLHGCKDYTAWRSTYVHFVRFLRELIASNPSTHAINFVHNLYFDALIKIYAFEKATGHDMLINVEYAFEPPVDGFAHNYRSLFASLYP